jgi:hypothetical protein
MLISSKCIHSLSMTLQSFVRPWPLFSFLILYPVGRTPRMGDQSVARPLPTHKTTQIKNKRTEISTPRMGFNPRCQRSSERRHFIVRPRGHCDRQDSYSPHPKKLEKINNHVLTSDHGRDEQCVQNFSWRISKIEAI